MDILMTIITLEVPDSEKGKRKKRPVFLKGRNKKLPPCAKDMAFYKVNSKESIKQAPKNDKWRPQASSQYINSVVFLCTRNIWLEIKNLNMLFMITLINMKHIGMNITIYTLL